MSTTIGEVLEKSELGMTAKSRDVSFPPKKRPTKKMIKWKPTKLGYMRYRNIGRNTWVKGDRIVHVVRSSEFGTRIRIKWRDEWKDDHVILYDYSSVGGPVCVIPVPVLFGSDFVKEKRKSDAYTNSGYWWSQTFPTDHELAKLVLSFQDRWNLL